MMKYLAFFAERRWIYLLFGAAMFLFAAVQYNDPHPIPWIVTYSATGIALIAAGFGRRLPDPISYTVSLGAFGMGFGGFFTRYSLLNVYEFGGLMVVGFAWLLIVAKSYRWVPS